MKLVSDCGRIVSEAPEFTPDPDLIESAKRLLEHCESGRVRGFACFAEEPNGMGVLIAGPIEVYALSAFAARRFAVMIEATEDEMLDE